jgi:hypothetical protein
VEDHDRRQTCDMFRDIVAIGATSIGALAAHGLHPRRPDDGRRPVTSVAPALAHVTPVVNCSAPERSAAQAPPRALDRPTAGDARSRRKRWTWSAEFPVRGARWPGHVEALL